MIKLFNKDALDFNYSELKVDAIVSDPPYNISLDTNYKKRYKGSEKHDFFITQGCKTKDWESFETDKKIDLSFLFQMNIKKMCLFGLNNYIECVPLDIYYGGSFSVWDKRQDMEGRVIPDTHLSGQFEMIWFYPKRRWDFLRHVFSGVFGTEKEEYKKRIHPTQKPVEVMKWCIEKLKLKEGDTVLDPFMGSGSTGRACQALGLNFIGIEINEGYYKLAEHRLLGGFQKEMFGDSIE